MNNTGIYYVDGKIIAKNGNVAVYDVNGQLYLEIGPGHTLWALESELLDYIEQLNDTLFGNVLEIGLGLGVASGYILSCNKVKTLTTIEINKNVIKTFNSIKKNLYNKLNLVSNKQHTIINTDGLQYMSNTQLKYDFIFIDCYSLINEETLLEIEELVGAGKKILNSNGIISGWFDKFTPVEYIGKFNEIFGSNYVEDI